MPAQSSIVVCKPQVPLSQRLVDPDLHRLTVAQLRKKARNNGLDVSRLTKKWEFVHILVQQRTQSVQAHLGNVTDTRRHNIFDLPGELRNKIYSFVLVDEHPVVAHYESSAEYGLAGTFCSFLQVRKQTWSRFVFANISTSQLFNMSWTNRRLRKEARGFFFSNNSFVVRGNEGSSHLAFLRDIGADGRSNIPRLDFNGTHFYMYNAGFLPILGECINLCCLTIRMHVGHIVKVDNYVEMRNYVKYKSNMWTVKGCQVEVSSVFNIFTQLPALRVLKITCAFPLWKVYSLWDDDSSIRQLKVAKEVQKAVSSALKNVLEGKNVKTELFMTPDAPRLSGD
jgi:hypothetical protein